MPESLKVPSLVRSLVYATLFISFVLVFLPAQVLRWSGVTRPTLMDTPQIAGMVLVLVGAIVAISCVITFGTIGAGTPAPFDPPRKLVLRGPYRYVRNPMYLGAAIALGGASLFYTSLPLLGFLIFFWVACHLFVLFYEEPTLRRTFGEEYEQYTRSVRRWVPKVR